MPKRHVPSQSELAASAAQKKKIIDQAKAERELKTQRSPNPYPPGSVIKRMVKKLVGKRNFQCGAIHLLQRASVDYAQKIAQMAFESMTHRGAKTLNPKDLLVVTKITEMAAHTPSYDELMEEAKAYQKEVREGEPYKKKKEDRQRKRAEKKSSKERETAAQVTSA